MKEEIKTCYIFLDTSIFIRENFFAGNKLQAFLKHEEESEIELLTTDITIKECMSNLHEFLANSNATFNQALKELNGKAKTFKNIESLNVIFNLQKTFDFEKEKLLLEEKLTKLISKHFKVVNIDSNKTLKVIDDYFNFKPPFKNGKKKHEFPDALVLNSLETWCKRNHRKIYVVADDDDFNSFESDLLIPIKEYDRLLDQISFTFSDENISKKIDEIIDEKRDEIISLIEVRFIDSFPTDGLDYSQGYEYEIKEIKGVSSYIECHSVLQIFDNVAKVELTVPIDYKIDVSYEDTNSGWYDREDDRWYGVENINRTISGECTLIVIVEIDFDLPGKEALWNDWKFIEISSGIPSDISIDE